MAKVINITDGTGSLDVLNGSYNVTANVNGYDNTSINPSSVNITAGQDSYSFTISATGTLTLHVTEDGTSGGVSIVGATFVRTDSLGTEYGSVVTTDSNGDAVFNNVPFASANAPTIYYKQLASDGNHEFDSSVQSVTLTTSSETVEVQNAAPAVRSFSLTDGNYDNLPIAAGSLTLE